MKKHLSIPIEMFISYDATHWSKKEQRKIERDIKAYIKAVMTDELSFIEWYDKGASYATNRTTIKIGQFQEDEEMPPLKKRNKDELT